MDCSCHNASSSGINLSEPVSHRTSLDINSGMAYILSVCYLNTYNISEFTVGCGDVFEDRFIWYGVVMYSRTGLSGMVW